MLDCVTGKTSMQWFEPEAQQAPEQDQQSTHEARPHLEPAQPSALVA
jgi:hypothetical protein